jgi:plasmid stabilization system protein ParE
MAYRVERALDTDRDLEAIFDFLVRSYIDFGEQRANAFERAAARLGDIEAGMAGIGSAPHQGTLRPDLAPNLRSVTKSRAIFYFSVDDDLCRVRILAVFFGGQDHQRTMLKRLLRRD